MKALLGIVCLAALASACSSSPASEGRRPVASREEVEHELIAKALKRQLGSPASYQPVSFVVDGVWTKKDSVSLIGLTSSANPGPYTKADSAEAVGRRYQHKFRAATAAGGNELQDKTVVVYPNDSVVVMNF